MVRYGHSQSCVHETREAWGRYAVEVLVLVCIEKERNIIDLDINCVAQDKIISFRNRSPPHQCKVS